MIEQRGEARFESPGANRGERIALLEGQHYRDALERQILLGEVAQGIGEDLLPFAARRHDDEVVQVMEAGQLVGGGDPVALLRAVEVKEAERDAEGEGERLP